MLDKHEQLIVDRLSAERSDLLSCNHINLEMSGRVEEISRQIGEIVGGDTFRSYELDVGNVVDDVDYEATDLDTGFDGNSHGFISQSFKNPDLDY